MPTPLCPSLKESRLSFSEREGGMPITLSQKERHHSFSEREREDQPNLLSERGDGEEGPLTSIKEEEESSLLCQRGGRRPAFYK